MERMNKKEMMEKISEMENEIKNLKEEINKQEEPKRRWKPEFHDKYYYIDSSGVVCVGYWENYDSDKIKYALGNVFKTEEEAKFFVEQLKVLAELKEYADDDKEWNNDNEHWCISYDTDRRSIDNDGCFHYVIHTPFNIYFSSKEKVKKAINAIGEERLKKYYFFEEDGENESI
jgi:hypothetical protein